MIQQIRSGARKLGSLWRDDTGNMLLELALVLPILTALGIGAFDFGRAYQEKLRMTNAARAGTQYALYNAMAAEDAAGVEQATRADANDTANALAVSVQYSCTCLDGSALACDDSCAGAEVPLKYITVVVSDDHAMLFQYPGMPASLSLQGSAQMRLR